MRHKKGFTLVELLFVTAIIGVVAAILAPALGGVRRRALAIQCASNLHQIGITVQTYTTANDEVIPFVNIGPEAQSDPKRMAQPSTGVPSLRRFLERSKVDPQLARCPADTGCAGQSFYPTPRGVSCYEDWGQSLLYNSSCYREVTGPGYDPTRKGALFGARPVRHGSMMSREATYILASDFWPHWHFRADANSAAGACYANVLFFDGHVEGQRFKTEKEGLAFLDWDAVRRWWVRNPGPLAPF
ncbi:MAG: type II secretion system protein [Verrucomicrobia bacterium]|nr:type II secretion system protein [Verrucomicrobiota bacterium]